MRILSLDAGATELLFALGAGSMVVARTDDADYPEAVLSVPSIGMPKDVTPQHIAALMPDLIIAPPGASFAEHETLSIDARTIEEVCAAIINLAKRTGKQIEGEMIVHELLGTLEHFQNRTARFAPVRVYLETSHTPPKASACYLRELVRFAGGEPYEGEVTLERLTAFDPYLIISCVQNDAELELLTARQGWGTLRAVRQERVFPLDARLCRPGPRLATTVRALGKLLHGLS